jgi:lipoprotein-anchoring transpeptidase ErfK/SrfK
MAWTCGAKGCLTHTSSEHMCPGWRLAPLQFSVGAKKKNAPPDVKVVQAGLNRVIGPAASERFATNGVYDEVLGRGIERFQRVAIGLSPDGSVDPGGRTYRALADTLALKRIVVSLEEQTLDALEDGRRVFSFPCVTGDGAHPTNKGTFRISRKHEDYTSKTYGSDMDYAMFFTNDGKAIHQYHGFAGLTAVRVMRHHVSDFFGSHGCVRLEEANARALFKWTPIGTQVYVY